MGVGLLALLLFKYAPYLGLYMAFSDYKLGRPMFSAKFVGLEHFREFFVDSTDFLYLLRNTLAMNSLSIIVCLAGALFFALILNECRVLPIKKIVQTSSFFPFFISWVIAFSIVSAFLSSQSGVINIALKEMGIIDSGIQFMTKSKYSWGLIVFSNLWKMLGYNSVLFLSAIAGVNMELYESADIDGADRLQKMWHITVPSILPTLQVLLVLNFGHIFQSSFEQFYLYTNQLNRPTMEVFDVFIYRMGIKMLDYSYATAVGVGKSIGGLVMIVFVNWLSKKASGRSVF